MAGSEAIVVGAGPAGLAAAAALQRRGIATTVLEREERVGARWRARYDGLRLNTMRQLSGLGGLRMSRRFGRYPARDDFVAYLEGYARHHGLDVQFGAAVERVERGPQGWALRTAGGPRQARFVVLATGYDAIPRLPDAPGLDCYEGELVHAQDFRRPADWARRDVLIVGAGNTGVDVAGLLDRAGARVAVTLRTPPNLFPRDLLGLPMQPTGVLLEHLPAAIGDACGRFAQRIAFGDLRPYGLPPAPQGYMSKFRSRLVGPAVDDGFVAGLKRGRIRIVAGLERFEGRDVVLADGARLRPDLVLCATGYTRGLEPLVGHLGVLRPDGIPIHHDGAPEHPATPGLFFAGFYGYPSGQLRVFARQARRIARAASREATRTSDA